MRILLGIFLIIIGALFVIKSEWLLQNFGRITWAEEKLGGEGGSRLMYKLIGIGVALIGMMMATNLLEGFFIATIGKLLLPPNIREQL